tara:strand:- start:788 stop:1072 length:285 start_codon:yes stop_codon:yes gene_type:complete
LYEDFVEVLSDVDALILLEVYAAGEEKIQGADSRALCRSIRLRGKLDPFYLQNENDVFELLPDILESGDILLTQGAGSVGALSKLITKNLFNAK